MVSSGAVAAGMSWVRAPEHRLAVAAAFSAIAAFVAGKAVALATGVEGTAFYGSLLSATTVLGGLALFGNLLALPQVRPEIPNGDWRDLSRLLARGIGPTFLVCMAVAPVLFVALLGTDSDYSMGALALGGIVAVIGAVWGPAERVVLSLVGTPTQILMQTVISGICYLAILCLALLALPPAWFPLWFGGALLVGQAVASLTIHIWAGAYGRVGRVSSATPAEHSRLGREMRSRSARLFATVSLGGIAYAALPALVLATAGAFSAGLFRSAFSVGTLALGALTSTIQLHIAPRVAQSSRGEEVSLPSLGSASGATLRLALLVTSVVAISSPLLLVIFFSADFLPATAALCILALGGLFRILTAINSTALMAHQLYRSLAIVEVGGALATLMLVGVAGLVAPNVAILALAYTFGALLGYIAAEAFCRQMGSLSSSRVILASRWDRVLALTCVASCAAGALIYGTRLG